MYLLDVSADDAYLLAAYVAHSCNSDGIYGRSRQVRVIPQLVVGFSFITMSEANSWLGSPNVPVNLRDTYVHRVGNQVSVDLDDTDIATYANRSILPICFPRAIAHALSQSEVIASLLILHKYIS